MYVAWRLSILQADLLHWLGLGIEGERANQAGKRVERKNRRKWKLLPWALWSALRSLCVLFTKQPRQPPLPESTPSLLPHTDGYFVFQKLTEGLWILLGLEFQKPVVPRPDLGPVILCISRININIAVLLRNWIITNYSHDLLNNNSYKTFIHALL